MNFHFKSVGIVKTRTGSLSLSVTNAPSCSVYSFTEVYFSTVNIDEDRHGPATLHKDL